MKITDLKIELNPLPPAQDLAFRDGIARDLDKVFRLNLPQRLGVFTLITIQSQRDYWLQVLDERVIAVSLGKDVSSRPGEYNLTSPQGFVFNEEDSTFIRVGMKGTYFFVLSPEGKPIIVKRG